MSNFAATINAAPAYIVNDIYKRYINPDTTAKKLTSALSRLRSAAVLLVGIVFGLMIDSISRRHEWIVGALYGGYVMANVLKWYWWRFNGYGYFWGMMAGIVGAMFVPEIVHTRLSAAASNPLYTFPVLLVLSLIGCIAGTYLSEPEEEAILKHFYKTTRPWGCWGPIRDRVMAEDPAFEPNRDFAKDAINVAVGIVWQLCLTSLPIFLVLRSWNWAGAVFLLLIVTSIFIKLNWYDKLPRAEQPEAA